jgi:hypothetical protein
VCAAHSCKPLSAAAGDAAAAQENRNNVMLLMKPTQALLWAAVPLQSRPG